jgi:NADH-quinone oxidoreductase subunit N
MNASLNYIGLEISVIGLGLVLMLADFFVPAERRRFIGYAGIAALGALLLMSFSGNGTCSNFGFAFNNSFVNDGMSLFFKRFFLIAAILVLFIASEFSDKFSEGSIAEYYSLIVFALAGMLFAASATSRCCSSPSSSSPSRFMCSSVSSAASSPRWRPA